MRTAASRPFASYRHHLLQRRTQGARGANLLADARHATSEVVEARDENDRSATGYLPREAFEAMADAFVARPDKSVCGCERAVDAHRRIVATIDANLSQRAPDGDIAVGTHGVAAALLMCALHQRTITRTADQPPGHGGFYDIVDPAARSRVGGWTAIDA